jgi:hypothetical protein
MNYVSILRVAEQVYKSGLNVDELNFYDMVEWAGEAIAKIGVPYAYIERVTNDEDTSAPDPIVIADFRGALPTDLVILQGVRDHSTKSSLIKEVGTFRTTYKSSNRISDNDSVMLGYRIEDGYIYTNFEEGEIDISYLAFQTDSDGFPEIPDEERYISAVKAYIMYMVAFRMWLQDKLSKDKYRELEQNWLFYCNSAKTKALMPDYDGAEALKNQLMKVRQSSWQHGSQFSYLSLP